MSDLIEQILGFGYFNQTVKTLICVNKKMHNSGYDKARIARVGATCVACDAVAKKVRRSATATEQFSKVRRKIVKNVEFC